MSHKFIFLFSLLSLAGILWFGLGVANVHELSPQGCRMSRMWPSYILHTEFNSSWTPLAKRYRLFLYREKENLQTYWQPTTVGTGVPVLFIPGNAGSYGQVRSIASSAERQFFHRPGVPSSEFKGTNVKPLDFFAVDFNEDLSAFHGPTMESEIAYTSRAIDYILSLYPPQTQIIVMGHSMGGVVATSLLPSTNISAIITMSTPHTLPPARFDSRIDGIYDKSLKALANDPTPIMSICGGAIDMQIPSEACILPFESGAKKLFRRTVFSSGLEGAWTGVGHIEMVWCHQVRWRVARAALELGAINSEEKSVVLDRWIRDGHVLPDEVPAQQVTQILQLPDPSTYELLPSGMHLVLQQFRDAHTYLLPLPSTREARQQAKFILYVSQGTIPPISPDSPFPYSASVYHCILSPADEEGKSHPRCRGLKPDTLKLIPNPPPGNPFPLHGQGVSDSEGVVLYEASLDVDSVSSVDTWIAVKMENGDGNGWVVGGFIESDLAVNQVSTFGLLFGGVSLQYKDHSALRTTYQFPNLLSHNLIVYSVTPSQSTPPAECPYPFLSPLITHISHSTETHYHPMLASGRTLLHNHLPAPYISSDPQPKGIEFVIYSSGSAKCRNNLDGFDVKLDWTATAGRVASRYFTAVVCWAIGVVLWIFFSAMGIQDLTGEMPSFLHSLSSFIRTTFPRLLVTLVVLSFVPFPANFFTGNQGNPLLVIIAPWLLFIATGLVCITSGVVYALLWFLHKSTFWISRRQRHDHVQTVQRSTLISMAMICILIFLVIPWQVAYLGCWFIQLYTCTGIFRQDGSEKVDMVNIPLLDRSSNGDHVAPNSRTGNEDDVPRFRNLPNRTSSLSHENVHVLVLMTWLLPLAAPVLIVWVRTLATAGITTPFEGDHDFFNVVPFLVLIDFASWNREMLLERQSFEGRISVRWSLTPVIVISFLLGPRKPYLIFDLLKVAIALIVIVRIGRRYWGKPGWSPEDHTRIH